MPNSSQQILRLLATLLILAFYTSAGFASRATEPAHNGSGKVEVVDETEDEVPTPMMLLALMFVAAVALIVVGAGAVVGSLACVVLAILVVLGVTSISILVGVKKGRIEPGLRTFILLMTAAGGMFVGTGAGPVANWLFDLHLGLMTTLPVGAIVGSVCGALIGIMIMGIWNSLRSFVLRREQVLPATM